MNYKTKLRKMDFSEFWESFTDWRYIARLFPEINIKQEIAEIIYPEGEVLSIKDSVIRYGRDATPENFLMLGVVNDCTTQFFLDEYVTTLAPDRIDELGILLKQHVGEDEAKERFIREAFVGNFLNTGDHA